MRSIAINLFLFVLPAFFWNCQGERGQQDSGEMVSGKVTALPYQIQEPARTIFLPFELEEVSGIAYLSDTVLMCVQDEKGTVFSYDLMQEKIVREAKFAGHGDYEDIAVVNEFAYVLKSNGQLWKVYLDHADGEAENYNTPLSVKNDVEGLSYDAANNRLLLACKGISGIGQDYSGKRAIYSFDLQENKLTEEPVYLIDTRTVEEFLSGKPNEDFRPSGIAVHPLSGHIYMIASVGKVLITLDKNGRIQWVTALPARLFKQPEGICFSPAGDMFISNEGRGGRGTILKFSYKTQ